MLSLSPKNNRRHDRGSLFLEAIFALGLLLLITASLGTVYPQLIQSLAKAERYSKLVQIAEYTGSYLFRWADFSPASKALLLKNYRDGSELELSEETRVNRLLWADPLVSGSEAIPDEYKASIQFWETTHSDRAVVNVRIWYDKNLDNAIDPSEISLSFSTVVTEKLAL